MSNTPLELPDKAQQIRSVDFEEERGLFQRIARTDYSVDVYKVFTLIVTVGIIATYRSLAMTVHRQMLMEERNQEEQKLKSRSASKISDYGSKSAQPYEVLVRSKNEEQPIVGYRPIFAQSSSHLGSVGGPAMNFRGNLEVSEMQIDQDVTREQSFTNQSDQFFQTFVQELKEMSYVTPFDKFVPHENQLPVLDASVEAKMLATSEIDPVREVFEQNLDEEIADYEAVLNLPSFEEFANKNEEVQRKMKENMTFWQSISPHEKPKPPTDQELKLLDYATLCNMYTGNWGMDEDSMMLQFFYKFQYDEKWRERIKKGCFSMLDECNPQSCGICKEITDEEVAKMRPECFFEIEDRSDYENVVMKLKEEFNKKYDEETNWDFKQLIMNPVDSDLDSDTFVSDEELQLCVDEKPSSKDWIRAEGTWSAPQGFNDTPRDEEDLLPGDMNCEDIEYLRYRDIVPQKRGDQAALETATLGLMKDKYEKKKADERKGYFWRRKSNYVYRSPDFRRKAQKY